MYNDVSKELASYLKSKSGLNRLMIKLKDKYIALSRPSGNVVLKDITKDECYDIGNILGKRLFEGTTINVSFKELTRKINEGKYHDFIWSDMLNYYFGNNLVTKKEQNSINKDEEYEFFKKIYESNSDCQYLNELKEIIVNDVTISRIIKHKYHKDKNELYNELENIFLLINNIPSIPTSLAVYASITGNPHYLDLNKSTCNLFLKILAHHKNVNFHDNTDGRISLLSEINVYTDPVSNFVITYKLKGNAIMNQLSEKNEVVNLNLLNLNSLDFISTDCGMVFVFENPSMLMSLIELNVPVVITSGIPNVSVYSLLDKLVESGNRLFYNGDFDPEGLIIAEKLKKRYSNLELFCYSVDDYNCAKGKERVSDSRIKKLDKISAKELLEVSDLIRQSSIVGYQEQNLIKIRNYIKNQIRYIK